MTYQEIILKPTHDLYWYGILLSGAKWLTGSFHQNSCIYHLVGGGWLHKYDMPQLTLQENIQLAMPSIFLFYIFPPSYEPALRIHIWHIIFRRLKNKPGGEYGDEA
jgi:hypothetical protein